MAGHGTPPRAAFYDAWAPTYDQQQQMLALLEQPVVERVLGRVRGTRALVLGCGTGRFFSTLLKAFAHIDGVDFSEGMLARARAKFSADIGRRITLRKADIERMRFPAGRYDLVLCTMVLGGIANRTRLIRACARTLRPGGHAVFSLYHPAQALKHRALRAKLRGNVRKEAPFERPWMVSDYVNAVLASGLSLVGIEEPRIDQVIARLFPKHRTEVGWPHVVILRGEKAAIAR